MASERVPVRQPKPMRSRLGQVINEQPRPRVLIYGIPCDQTADVQATIAEVAPTVDVTTDLGTVDLTEFDCVVTMRDYAFIEEVENKSFSNYPYGQEPPKWWAWKQHYPPHVSIIRLYEGWENALVDFLPAASEEASEEMPAAVIMVNSRIPGKHVRYATDLSDYVAELVKRSLATAAKGATEHMTFEAARPKIHEVAVEEVPEFDLRPFLFGPSDQILAASYERSSEASVWLLPLSLIGSLREWVAAALREWHDLYPSRFPALPDWQTAPAWANAAEADLIASIDEARRKFEVVRRKHDEDVARLQSELLSAREAANSYERQLLTGTGEALEVAAGMAMRALGFEVQMMDEVWPERARREDFRITDLDAPDWIAIGEAKGFGKGVQETGLQALQRFVSFYVSESGRMPNRQWYIANSFLREDPATRQQPLNGRSDAVEVFAGSDGLIIDTRALFVLLIAVQREPAIKSQVKSALRRLTGTLTLDGAKEMLDGFS